MDQLLGIGGPSHNEYQALADHIANIDSWSTTAQKIGTYGNLTVYRQMFIFDSAQANVEKTIASDVGGNGRTIIDIGGVAIQTDGSTIKLGGYYADSSYSAVWIGSNKGLYCKSKSAITGGIAYVIYAI